MESQVDLKLNSYKSTLSPQQRQILEIVETGTLPLVKLYFEKLSKTEKTDKWFDYVLLTTALKRDHKSLIRFLLKSAGCRAKTEEKFGFHCAPLYYAFEKNDLKIATDLIKKGASIHHTDFNDKSPLAYALQDKEREMIDVILQNLKSVDRHKDLDPDNEDDIALFHLACSKNNSEATKIFLKRRFPVNSRSRFDNEEWSGFTPLHFAVSGTISYSDESSVNLLLKKDVDFLAQDKNRNTPIHLAFRNSYPKYRYTSRDSDLPEKWMSNLMKKNFSNLEDKHGLSFFQILCCGLDKCEASKYMSAIQLFLDNGVDVNKSVSLNDETYPGWTALHFAVMNLRMDITKLLLEKGANVNKTNKHGSTALHLVCDSSTKTLTRDDFLESSYSKKLARLAMAELLLQYGAEVDVLDLQGSTPVHYAFYSKGKYDTLTQLLISKSKLDINHTDCNGLSYLHIASCMDLSAVKTLVERGGSVNSYVKSDAKVLPGYSALHLAVSFNKVDIVNYLLEHEADPIIRSKDDFQVTPLHLACMYTFKTIHNCRDWKIEVDLQNDLQLLHSAKMRIVELLLKHGASINEGDIHGNTPLMNAILIIRDFSFFKKTEDSLDVRKKIIENINVGQREMIEFLIRNGADIHARDVNGESILHVIAIGTGYPEKIGFAEMMLDNKVDVNAVDDQGLTPLHMVAQKAFNDSSHVKLIQLFEKHGADINAMSPEYGTPLHVAISKNEYDPDEDQVFDYLLAHPDIDINARKASGDTPLHIAADKCVNRQVFSCLEKLLSAGADINLENTVGDPPLHRLCKWLLVNLEDDPEYYEYYGDSLPNEFCLQVSKMIVTHFKKLTKINVHVSEKVREKFNSLIQLRSEEYSATDIDIEQELNQLKSRMLNQYVSLHGILCEDPNKMFKYANNDHFKKIIESSSLEKDFPIFHDFITLQFKRGSIRHSILCKAKNALAILSRVNWPDYCAEYILGCLDDADLRSLIKSASTIRYSEKSQDNPQQPSIISKKLRCD